MKLSQQLLAFLLFIALMIKKGIAIKCYQCSSYAKDNCPFGKDGDEKPLYLNECTGNFANATMCTKIEQSMYYDDDDRVRTFYGCAVQGKVASECKERTGTHRFKSWYCYCKDDGCNSSTSVVSSLVITLTALLGYAALRNNL